MSALSNLFVRRTKILNTEFSIPDNTPLFKIEDFLSPETEHTVYPKNVVVNGILFPPWQTVGDLRTSIQALCDAQLVPPYWPPVEQFGGLETLTDSLTKAFLEKSSSDSGCCASSRAKHRFQVYDGTFKRLQQAGVDCEKLKVIVMIAPGGTPSTKYCFGPLAC